MTSLLWGFAQAVFMTFSASVILYTIENTDFNEKIK